MGELRRDPVIGRWVITNVERPMGPGDFEREAHEWKKGECPFCSGNEGLTPPEIEAVRQTHTKPNTPGWSVRVVPNKFPALRIEGDLERSGVGVFDMTAGVGAHEIIIESPDHHKELSDLDVPQIRDVIDKYCSRCLDLKKDKRFKYILIFKNYGPSAGASLEHPHSQLIALPMVPKNVMEELSGSADYFGFRDRCIFCDIIQQEQEEEERIILETDRFIAFCPFVSRFAFEAWIVPKKHSGHFHSIDNGEKEALAAVIKETLLKIKNVLSDPSYNFIIHTSPLGESGSESYHWHIEIMPKLTRVAGFEWGTGFYIVPTPPELAAGYLRKIKV